MRGSTRMAWSRSGDGMPSALDVSVAMGAGVALRWGTPRASASLGAGSIVHTSVRKPLRAPITPKAAAVVVFPTPPGPTQTKVFLPVNRCFIAVVSLRNPHQKLVGTVGLGLGRNGHQDLLRACCQREKVRSRSVASMRGWNVVAGNCRNMLGSL